MPIERREKDFEAIIESTEKPGIILYGYSGEGKVFYHFSFFKLLLQIEESERREHSKNFTPIIKDKSSLFLNDYFFNRLCT